MNRPFAYVSAAWSSDPYQAQRQAVRYCRAIYDAGYSPICPYLMHTPFLNDSIPAEHKDATDMASDLLRRCRIVVFCGKVADERVKDEIALASRLRISSTSLTGIREILSAQVSHPSMAEEPPEKFTQCISDR